MRRASFCGSATAFPSRPTGTPLPPAPTSRFARTKARAPHGRSALRHAAPPRRQRLCRSRRRFGSATDLALSTPPETLFPSSGVRSPARPVLGAGAASQPAGTAVPALEAAPHPAHPPPGGPGQQPQRRGGGGRGQVEAGGLAVGRAPEPSARTAGTRGRNARGVSGAGQRRVKEICSHCGRLGVDPAGIDVASPLSD